MYLFKCIANNRHLISIWVDSEVLLFWVDIEGNPSRETIYFACSLCCPRNCAGKGVESLAFLRCEEIARCPHLKNGIGAPIVAQQVKNLT